MLVAMNNNNLCSFGLSLHKAHCLVKFEGHFFDSGDRQALKRICRVSKREKSFVWRFITKDNTEECIMRRRQELRAGIVNEAAKLPTDDYNIREVESKIDYVYYWQELYKSSCHVHGMR